jgi:peptidoglycan glycosyltransferase
MSVAERKIVTVEGRDVAARWLGTPGSTMKPLTLWALLESGKLKASDEYLCPRKLVLDGRALNCSHPVITIPMNVSRAIAYSCNCAVAHFAQRLQPNELPDFLRRLNVSSSSGLFGSAEARGVIRSNLSGEQLQLQALGEDGVRMTPLELVMAYRTLARRCQEAALAPILEGLEGAVEYGTGQRAGLQHVKVAGKTGSVRTAGVPAAWFAGFAPSRAPEVAVTVLVQGASGGADAAPIAERLLQSYFASRS